MLRAAQRHSRRCDPELTGPLQLPRVGPELQRLAPAMLLLLRLKAVRRR